MDSGYVALSAAILGIAAVALVVAAFHDRRRGREIEHDLRDMGRARSRPSPGLDQPRTEPEEE